MTPLRPARSTRRSAAAWLGGLAVLSDARFRAFVVGELARDLATAMRLAAQSWLVLALTDSSLWVGIVVGVGGVPAVALALFGGVFTDRVSKRRILVSSRVGMALIALATGALVASGRVEPWHLAVLSAGAGAVMAFSGPAMWALIAELVDPRRLASANGLVTLTYNIGEMAGPAIVGAVIARANTETAFWVVAAGYAAGALLMLRVRTSEGSGSVPGSSVLRDLREGLSYARRMQPLPWLFTLVGVSNLLGVAVFPLVPVYARDVLDVGAAGFGLLGGAMGAGALAGALAISLFGNFPRKGLVLVLSGVVWDSCMISFGFSRVFPLSMALLFTMGLAGSYWLNAAVTVFQSTTTPALRGRVMSLYVISMQMFPLGWLYGGAVATAVGNEWALIISAIGGSSVTVTAFILSPALRRA